SHAALAAAYGAAGRADEADRTYRSALNDLDTTSPSPHAWLWFARGELWAGRDPARAEIFYARALAHLPEFAAAGIHLAELAAAPGRAAGGSPLPPRNRRRSRRSASCSAAPAPAGAASARSSGRGGGSSSSCRAIRRPSPITPPNSTWAPAPIRRGRGSWRG